MGDPATRLLFADDAASSFHDFLGFKICAAGLGPAVSPTDLIGNYTVAWHGTDRDSRTAPNRASMSKTTSFTSYTTQFAVSSIISATVAAPIGPPAPASTSIRTRIALGTGLSLGPILICVCLALTLRRSRKNRRLVHSGNGEDLAIPTDDQLPYL